ncbi:regulatory LuxR family protein [Erwinia sp. JUb26]|nr:regulatory LuxR family protein [Erwinia sp. JUb26]
MSGTQGIRVDIMELNSGIKSSRNVLSHDQYFILGLMELLGTDFLEAFYQVVDLDFNDINECRDLPASRKKTVAFASSDLAYYNSELYEEVAVLDKTSSLKEIISFFAREDTPGNYHIKFNLTHREKQMLNLLRKGESNKDIALKLGITLKTIYSHRRNLMMKLGCENRIMFHKLFLKNRLITSA